MAWPVKRRRRVALLVRHAASLKTLWGGIQIYSDQSLFLIAFDAFFKKLGEAGHIFVIGIGP